MIKLFGVDDSVWDVDHWRGGCGSWGRERLGPCTGCGCDYGDGGAGGDVAVSVAVMWTSVKVDVGRKRRTSMGVDRSMGGEERCEGGWRVGREDAGPGGCAMMR